MDNSNCTKTLAVKAKLSNTEVVVPISLGQTGFDNIRDFIQNDTIVTWNIPDRLLTLRLELTADSLSVEFIQDKKINETLKLTWPLVEDFQSLQGYILSLFEGCYVPKIDSRWQDFLIDRGPLNTTADLSMPFFGLDIKDQTLTYILTNPLYHLNIEEFSKHQEWIRRPYVFFSRYIGKSEDNP